MTEAEWHTLRQLYLPLLRRFVEAPEAVGWEGTNQRRRFAALTAGWTLEAPCTLLDVGCGVGHLFDWLCAQQKLIRYIGIDALPEMAWRAAKRTHQPCRVLDAESDALPPCDYAVASGVFNVYLGDFYLGDYGFRNQRLLTTIVNKMRACARLGVAFDCLLTTHPRKVKGQAYYDEGWLMEQLGDCSPGVVCAISSAGIPGNCIVQLTKEVAHAGSR